MEYQPKTGKQAMLPAILRRVIVRTKILPKRHWILVILVALPLLLLILSSSISSGGNNNKQQGANVPTIQLQSGDKIPAIGLGTWQSEPGVVANVVVAAIIEAGYRHIDCAAKYGNEKEIGQAFQKVFHSGLVKRPDVFVTSKLWNTMHNPKDVQVALKQTLHDLGLDYLDLYLMHWPVAMTLDGQFIPLEQIPIAETWKAMEQCVDQGLVRNIGVSNFSIKKLQDLLQVARIQPAMNQIERHPYLQQLDLLDFCKKNGIVVTAYSPLGTPGTSYLNKNNPTVLQDELISQIAKKHNGSTPAQVLIQWAIQSGTAVIPKTTKKHRLMENLHPGFVLDPEDMANIAKLDRHLRYIDGKHMKEPYTQAYLWEEDSN